MKFIDSQIKKYFKNKEKAKKLEETRGSLIRIKDSSRGVLLGEFNHYSKKERAYLFIEKPTEEFHILYPGNLESLHIIEDN